MLATLKIVTILNIFMLHGRSDEDAKRTTCEIVTARGYPCEIHHVTTDDGYILDVHRIPRGKNEKMSNGTRKVIFLQHGLEDSSATWVINMEKQSLGFIAADAKLDVWMGNVRGNTYGRKHVKRNVSDPLFWNFTFHEMANYDLANTIDYVIGITKQQLYYVGHSQGTVIAFVLFSSYPYWSKNRIKQYHALAPSAWLGRSTSSIRQLAPLVSAVSKLFPSSGMSEFNAGSTLGTAIGALSCNILACTNFASYMTNSDLSHYNMSRNDVYTAKVPAGTSTMNIWHYIQLAQDGQFETYGSNPVPYHVNTTKVPTYLYWSSNDVFTQPDDFAMLKNALPSVVKIYQNDSYDHMDFVWSLNAARDIYTKIINATLNG